MHHTDGTLVWWPRGLALCSHVPRRRRVRARAGADRPTRRFFCEKAILGYFIKIVTQKCDKKVKIQVIQNLSILIQVPAAAAAPAARARARACTCV
jgi:hypothetical protein